MTPKFLIDAMAPIMWIFIIAFVLAITFGIIRAGYFFIVAHPCDSYFFLSNYFGPVGDTCLNLNQSVNTTVI